MFRGILRAPHPMNLVFPPSILDMDGMLPLIRAEKAEFEAVFCTEVLFVDEDPGSGPRWLIDFDPDRDRNELVWDHDALTLTSRARDATGFMTTLNLLHSLVGLGMKRVTDAPEASTAAAVERVYREIAGTFPGFGIRGLDWDEITVHHVRGDGADMTFAEFQRWIAELDDAHTAIRRPVSISNPPSAVELTPDAVTLRRVPEWSAAWRAGVRAGWELDIDRREDWLLRTGAPLHAKALTAGRRAIALDGIDERVFGALSPDGKMLSWFEKAKPFSLDGVFDAQQVDARTGYLHPGNWITGIGFEDAFDHALMKFRGLDRLILDLQGNTGGNLMLATQMRNRFLRERTHLGSIQFSTGGGSLAAPVELWAEPEHDRIRWERELIVLTDSLTYSASEDFLLGLQGLPHVTVVGQPSGGGSGRPRTIRITDGVNFTVSTALTFDRSGICVENHGIPVDIECEVFADDGRNVALEYASRL